MSTSIDARLPRVAASDRDLALARAREQFSGLKTYTYTDVAGRCLLPGGAKAAVDALLQTSVLEGGDKPAMFRLIEQVRSKFARLVNASDDEIAFTKNVSEGLNMIAAAIDWRDGDEVILCSELEHPNNIYCWLNLEKRRGVHVRIVPPQDGHILPAQIAEAITPRTRLITVAAVTFAPGFRTDIAAIGALCRARDIFFLVDGAQSAGISHTDVEAMGIDALAVSTQKGLLGLYGMGFLYCRRGWAERLAPAYLARFGVDLGDSNEAAFGDMDYRLAPAARRFDLGNYNFAGAAAADFSLSLLLEIGTQAIEAHTHELAYRLAEGFLQLDLPVAGGRPGPHLANIVTLGNMGAGHDSTDDQAMASLYEHLFAHHVRLSIRRGLLRFSMHLYNNSDDMDRILALTKTWRDAQN